jgi:hypothetical protein
VSETPAIGHASRVPLEPEEFSAGAVIAKGYHIELPPPE